jgi:tetratricopeptide (TPR) repeat protein
MYGPFTKSFERAPLGKLLIVFICIQISWLPCYAETIPETNPKVTSLNNEGVKALNSNDLEEAIGKFSEALKLDPGYRLAKQNIAIAYSKLGESLKPKPAEAAKDFRKSLIFNYIPATKTKLDAIIQQTGHDPHDYKQRTQLAEEAVEAGDYPSAVIEYTEALRLQDDNDIHKKLEAAYKLLTTMFQMEDLLRVASPLHPTPVDPALSSQPRRVVQLNNEGVTAINNHNFQEAVKKLTDALQEAPNYALARQNLSIAHSGYGATLMEQPKKALEEFHKAMLLDLASDSKRYDVNRAISALGLNAGNYKDRLELCDAAVQQHNYVSAVVECSEALRLHDSPDIRSKLWLLYPALDPIYQTAKYRDLLPVKTLKYPLSKFFPKMTPPEDPTVFPGDY